jgi:CBS domain-containing protein
MVKIRDIMTEPAIACSPDTNLAAAAELMWSADCGVLPVVEDGKLCGILTDRDICIALGTRSSPAAQIAVRDVAAAHVETCTPESDVHSAMHTMRRAKVRRLPVVDEQGYLKGLLGLNDIILAVDRKGSKLTYEEVMNTVKAVSEHRHHKSAASQGQTATAAVA